MAAIGWEDSWCNGWLVQQVQQVQQDDCTAVRTTVARWVLWQLPQIVAPNLQHCLEAQGWTDPMAQGWTVAVHSTVTVYGIQHTAYGRRHKAVGIRPYFLVFELLTVLVPYRNSSGV